MVYRRPTAWNHLLQDITVKKRLQIDMENGQTDTQYTTYSDKAILEPLPSTSADITNLHTKVRRVWTIWMLPESQELDIGDTIVFKEKELEILEYDNWSISHRRYVAREKDTVV